jgi:ABC-2 type transport system ATP-binding protein/lipopolysaccharide transport system ATP-binding protein
MEPDEGTISRSGKIAAILELGMGFHQDMTGRENIYIKGELYGFSKKEMDSKIEGIIDYSGVRMYIDNPVRTYSSGMIGRLAFAIMVNVESDIILVDEVLSVGDSSFSAKAMQHFNEMAESGKTVLIVSHNLGYVEQACNRVIWIENGKVALDGNPADVCAQYQNRINEDPEIILDLAQSGVPDAQYRLALMYRDGNYFQKDKA